MTHPKNVRCALVSDAFQHEVELGTCCSYHGRDIAEALELLGDLELAKQVAETKTAEEAAEFARDLDFAVNLYGCELKDEPIEVTPEMRATETLIEGAIWFTMVAEAGFGVRSTP